MASAVLTPTDPHCGAAKHQTVRAHLAGCRCPEAVALHDEWLVKRRGYDQARIRRRPKRTRPAPPERVNLVLADWVIVERALKNPPALGDVGLLVDQVAIVAAHLERGDGTATIGRLLRCSDATAKRLVAIAERSRQRVRA